MPLSKKQLERYAEVLLWGISVSKRKAFKNYDLVIVNYDLPALPLAEVLHRRLLEVKRNPVMRLMPVPAMERNFYRCSDSRQRRFLAPGETELSRGLSGSIYLHAPESLAHLRDIDPALMNEAIRARRQLKTIQGEREAAGDYNWTLCTYPTGALASRAGISVREYAGQVIRACFLNEDNPVERWKEVHRNAGEIKQWLYSLRIESLQIEGHGFALGVKIGDRRRFMGVSGRNIPSFEIFTSPDCRGTEGTYFADQPSFKNGNIVEGARLEFRNGRVVSARAKKGEGFLRAMIDIDKGACRIGEVSLTDRRFSRINRFMADTLYDENYGGRHGNCHIALGSSYATTFDGNPLDLTPTFKRVLGFNDSSIHWDLVNTQERMVTAVLRDGVKKVIYEKGEFRI
jgi:aminopeptidase